MGNFGKIEFAENIQQQNHTLDTILDEIEAFNNEYGFIESFATSIRQRINALALCDEWFDEERLIKTEDILHFATSLEKMWLEIYDYRGEEFYENNKLSAFGNKIGLNICDTKLFKEFISTQSEETSERFYTFLFQVILDSLHKSDFYWELRDWEEKNKSISDQIEYLENLWNINSVYINFLIEDYKNTSLYQSLLSKFVITHYAPDLSVTSLNNIQNFSVLTEAWDESFKALRRILHSDSQENHHEQHLRLLADFLQEKLETTNKMIFNELMEAKEDFVKWKIKKMYRSQEHKNFVEKFFNLAHARRHLVDEILSQKKDEN